VETIMVLEFEGKTEQEAIEIAMTQLQAQREELDIEIKKNKNSLLEKSLNRLLLSFYRLSSIRWDTVAK
jgi:hypothetical protein